MFVFKFVLFIDYEVYKLILINSLFISGVIQVSVQSKEGYFVVVLMGFEFGEKLSQKVNDVLKNIDFFQCIDL